MKEFYDMVQDLRRSEGNDTKTWTEYWNYMLKDGIWADNWFVQATAWFLKLDFWIILEKIKDPV